MLVAVAVPVARFATAAGGVVSGHADVLRLGELDIAERLGTSSDVFKAKKYVAPQLNPVTVKL
jgi:hypothetical protein